MASPVSVATRASRDCTQLRDTGGFDLHFGVVTGEHRDCHSDTRTPPEREVRAGVEECSSGDRRVRPAHRYSQTFAGNRFVDFAVKCGDVWACGNQCRGIGGNGAHVKSVRRVCRGIGAAPECGIERCARRREPPARGFLLVVRLCECQIGLERLEPRRRPGLEPIARGIARALGEPAQLRRHLHAAGGGDKFVVRQADRAPDIERLDGQVGNGPCQRRVGEVDPARPLAPELQRKCDARDFVRRVPCSLERCLGIRSLPGDRDAGHVHGATETRGDQGSIVFFGDAECRLKGERNSWRRLGSLIR